MEGFDSKYANFPDWINGITHEIWVAFPNQQSALAFLDGMYASSEFAEYIVKANELSVFKRSYMEVSLNMFNPD